MPENESSDSTTGVKSAVSGICDIGMASRDLKKSELDEFRAKFPAWKDADGFGIDF